MACESTAGLSGPPFPITLIVALIAETALVITGALWLVPVVPQQPVHEPPFQVSLVQAPPAASKPKISRSSPVTKAQRKPAPRPIIPKPESRPKHQPKPQPQLKLKPNPQTMAPSRTPEVVKQLPKRKQPPASHRPRPPPASNPESVPSPAQTEVARLTASFKEQVRAAVLSAANYPRAARMFGLQGQAEIAFDFRDGQVSNVHIARSSNVVVLDQAALRAVRTADYPTPPPALNGKRLQFSIVIRFRRS